MKRIILVLLVSITLTLSSCTTDLTYNDFLDQHLTTYGDAETVSSGRYVLFYYDREKEEVNQDVLSFFQEFDLLNVYFVNTNPLKVEDSIFGGYQDTDIVYVVSNNEVEEQYEGEVEILTFIDKYRDLELDYDDFASQHLTSYDEVLSIDNDYYILYYYFEDCPHCMATKPTFLPWAFTKNTEDIYFMNGAKVSSPDDLPTELIILNSGTPILVLMSNGKFADEYYSGTEAVLGFIEEMGDNEIERIYEYEDFADNTLDSYDDTLNVSNNVHIEYFYSPYCSHCTSIKDTSLGFFDRFDEIEFYLINTSTATGTPKIPDFSSIPSMYIVANNVVVKEYIGTLQIKEFYSEYEAGNIDLSQYE